MTIETERDLAGLRRVGKVVALALEAMKEAVRPGVSTRELDAIGGRVLRRYGARSAPHLFYGFPGINCISINDEAVHGIPGKRKLRPGDLVKLDVTAELDGYIADAAITHAVPPMSEEAQTLIACAEAAFQQALSVARASTRVNEIGRAIQTEVNRRGFAVLPELYSHGVGRSIHEEPSIPQYYAPRLQGRLIDGLVITIEPIITGGRGRSVDAGDGWTIRTVDGSRSAHYEHTVVITRDRPILVTAA